MPSELHKFRQRYPEYNDLTDDEVAENLHQHNYPDMDLEAIRWRLGIAPVGPQAPDPTIADRIDGSIQRRALTDDPLVRAGQRDILELAKEPGGVVQTWLQDIDEANSRGFLNNSARLAAERGSSLIGHAISGIIGRPGEWIGDKLNVGQIVYGTDWGPGDPADGKFRIRYMTPDEIQALDQEKFRNLFSDTLPEFFQEADLGGRERHTTQRVKDAFHRGEIMGTIGASIAFSLEQGIQSVPDMISVMMGPASLSAYVMARSDEMGDVRQEHKDDAIAADFIDNLEALPGALGSALFERFGAKLVFGAFGRKAAEQIGGELIERGMAAAAKRIGTRTGKAALGEMGTEAFQEGMFEYLGEKFGTGAELSWAEALERAGFGAMAGGISGGTIGGTAAVSGEVTRNLNAIDAWLMEEGAFEPRAAETAAAAEPAAPDTDFDEEGNVVPTAPDVPHETPETPPSDTATETSPDSSSTYLDNRLKREPFRMALANMVSELDFQGQAGALIRGPSELSPESDPLGQGGEVIGRMPSMNPEWFQDMGGTDLYMPPRAINNAIKKALNGERLGVRQARVVEYMLDVITDTRTGPAEMNHAREMLEQARAARRRARENITIETGETLEDDPFYDDNAGEIFEEGEYLPDMDAEGRIVYELMDRLRDFSEEAQERAAIILEGSGTTAEAIKGLEALIHEQQATPTRQEGDRAPETPGPAAETPQEGERAAERTRPTGEFTFSDISGLEGVTVNTLNQLEKKGYIEQVVPDKIGEFYGRRKLEAPFRLVEGAEGKLTEIQQRAIDHIRAGEFQLEQEQDGVLPAVEFELNGIRYRATREGDRVTVQDDTGRTTSSVAVIVEAQRRLGMLQEPELEDVSPDLGVAGDLFSEQANRQIDIADIDQVVNQDNQTGAGNANALEEAARSASAVGSVEIRGLEGIRRHMGEDVADGVIQAVTMVLEQAKAEVYHVGDGKFYVLGDDSFALQKQLESAEAKVFLMTAESEVGKIQGLELRVGVGQDMEMADKNQRGLRVREGELPHGAVLYSGRPLNMEPGSNYVGMIGKLGDLPLDANGSYMLASTGKTVRIPDTPVRRKHIMDLLQRRFGVKIYQGRVKGKTRLGFYRRDWGEIRIKNANDLEVTAHEVSHWLDDRHPWIQQLYKQYKSEMEGVSYDVKKLYEGYAEFMRLWFTQEHMARQAAPGFYDAWMAALEDHPGLKSITTELQELMHGWYLQGARARLEDRYGRQDTTLGDRIRRITDRFRERALQKIFDGLRPFKTIEREIRGGLSLAATSGYKTLRLARGTYGIVQAVVHKGSIEWDENGDLQFNGKGIKAIFDPVSDRMVEMQNYMVARRAQELMRQGREHHVRPDEIKRGLQFGRDDPQLVEVFEDWLAFNERMLEFYKQSGLVSDESLAAIKEMNENYVPFNRIIDAATGERKRSTAASPFMRLKGGTHNINDVFESIIGNTAQMVQMALVNKGKAAFYEMLEQSTEQIAGIYAARIPKETKPTQIDQEQVLKAVLEGMGLSMGWYRMAKTGMMNAGSKQEFDAQIEILNTIDRMTEGMGAWVTFFQVGQNPQGPNVDFYFKDGDRVFYEIGDPLLMEAINQVGPRSFNLAASILGGFANVLRKGVTLTPTFQAKNFIRDTMNAFTLSKGKIVPAAAATKALLERLYTDEHYWEYMVNGGGFAAMADADGINRDRVIDGHKRLRDFFEAGVSAPEYANRIAEFKVLRQRGWTARDAALAGREISTDFAMRGSSEILRWFTLSIPFLNARLQGLYRNGRELAELQEGKARFLGGQALNYALRSLVSITIPTLYLYMMNRDDERYQELPDWIRDLSWVIFYGPGEDDYVMIPKPFETGMIWGTLPERMIEYMFEHDEEELAEAMVWMAAETFALQGIPQAFKPYDELRTNRSFTGAPIVPEYMQDVEPSEQYRFYTSDAMIALGRKLDISPAQAEHLVRGYFGTLGAWALGAADMLAGDVHNGGAEPTKRWQDNILLSPFVDGGPMRRTESEDELYELLQETQRVVNTVRLISRRDPDRVEEYIELPINQALSALNSDLAGWAADTRELKNAQDQVRMDETMDGDQKRREIEALQRDINSIARDVYANINPDLVQELIDQAESAAIRERRAVGE